MLLTASKRSKKAAGGVSSTSARRLKRRLENGQPELSWRRTEITSYPPNHPLTCEVARVASRIITASNLGEVKGIPQTDEPGVGTLGTSYATFKGGWSSHGVVTVEERLQQEWEVFVIKDDAPNAFVTEGGKIFVFTGILPYLNDDGGLATILGHEIAHQALRHIGERASDLKVMGALALFLELLGLDVGFSRVGLTLLMMLPNSRKHESEGQQNLDQSLLILYSTSHNSTVADTIGLRLMAQACFDLQAAVGVWGRLYAMEEEGNAILKAQSWFNLPSLGDFLQTHPATTKQIVTMQRLVPSALQVRASSVCSLEDGHYIGGHYQTFREQQQVLKGLEYV
ncbi:hypothetical protein FRB93_010404 [Tulasnella sp. JGI-2019a]|nr:hypothetical protein FRB93_010404 [Tulasnella sp. JGI-2019a]